VNSIDWWLDKDGVASLIYYGAHAMAQCITREILLFRLVRESPVRSYFSDEGERNFGTHGPIEVLLQEMSRLSIREKQPLASFRVELQGKGLTRLKAPKRTTVPFSCCAVGSLVLGSDKVAT
jgi:hypothetical protein